MENHKPYTSIEITVKLSDVSPEIPGHREVWGSRGSLLSDSPDNPDSEDIIAFIYEVEGGFIWINDLGYPTQIFTNKTELNLHLEQLSGQITWDVERK